MANKKLTIEFIQEEFFKEQYILLTKIYANNVQKLEYVCPEGHKHSISWSNWKSGYRCPLCAHTIKPTIEFIKGSFEKHNYKFLTKKYKNNKQKLEYICPKGHKHSITWNDWQQGKRCPYCYGNIKLEIDFVKRSFEKYNYKLLTVVYVNNTQKLEYVCPKGHKHFITWLNWQNGHRCPFCAINAKPSIDTIKERFEKESYILLTEKYINSKQKLEYSCPKGHRYFTSWNKWRNGYRCPYCAGLVKLTIEFVRESFKKYGYELLTKKYVNSYQKLDYICSEGHKHFITWNNWQHGYRCPTCATIKKFGSGNHNWKGGISKEPYCQDWTKDLKEFVKERDGYKCMNPSCWGKDAVLTVHHINYNKKSCGPENLITICRSCNSRANFDRSWHEAWYKAVLYRRGYNYGITI